MSGVLSGQPYALLPCKVDFVPCIGALAFRVTIMLAADLILSYL
jgi:hypothetical protein